MELKITLILGLLYIVGGGYAALDGINLTKFSFERRNELGYIPASIIAGLIVITMGTVLLLAGVVLFGISLGSIIFAR